MYWTDMLPALKVSFNSEGIWWSEFPVNSESFKYQLDIVNENKQTQVNILATQHVIKCQQSVPR